MVNNNDTITLPRNVVEQALEALTNCTSEYGHRCNRCDSEVDPNGNISSALRAALDQTQEPPYGECDECGTEYSFDPTDGGSICVACLKERLKQPQCEQEHGIK